MSSTNLVHRLLHALAEWTGTLEEGYCRLTAPVLHCPGHDRRYVLGTRKTCIHFGWDACAPLRTGTIAAVSSYCMQRAAGVRSVRCTATTNGFAKQAGRGYVESN